VEGPASAIMFLQKKALVFRCDDNGKKQNTTKTIRDYIYIYRPIGFCLRTLTVESESKKKGVHDPIEGKSTVFGGRIPCPFDRTTHKPWDVPLCPCNCVNYYMLSVLLQLDTVVFLEKS